MQCIRTFKDAMKDSAFHSDETLVLFIFSLQGNQKCWEIMEYLNWYVNQKQSFEMSCWKNSFSKANSACRQEDIKLSYSNVGPNGHDLLMSVVMTVHNLCVHSVRKRLWTNNPESCNSAIPWDEIYCPFSGGMSPS